MSQATNPHTTPTRRSALFGAAAVTVATIVTPVLASAATDPDADAELISVCQAFLTADVFIHVPGISDGDYTAASARYYEALGRLTDIPARTAAGRRVKAFAGYRAMAAVADDMNGREELAGLSALADIVGEVSA